MMIKVLIIDDDQLSREIFVDTLSGLLDILIVQSESGKEALEYLKKEDFDIIFSDIKMPGMNGIDLLREYKKLGKPKKSKFVLFTGFATIDSAIKALREGAYDYLLKPLDIRRVIEIIKEHSDNPDVLEASEDDRSKRKIKKNDINSLLNNGSYLNLSDMGRIGVFSKEMKENVAVSLKFNENRTIPVLIQGESGTGKEIIAHLVHNGIGKSNLPFISINCSAISPSLFESELFGYEGGAFTGSKDKGMPGKLDLAEGGTVFLDEIGDLPIEMQPKLLRVLQERAFYRVGGLKKIPIDVRIIAATNKQLELMVNEGKFRKDLYYRLNFGWIFLPPLKEQREAIPLLAQLFLNEFSDTRKRQFKFISPRAIDILQEYDWPGNIRELKNIIDRIALLYDEFELNETHLGFLKSARKSFSFVHSIKPIIRPGNFELPDEPLDMQMLELEIVRLALEKFGNNKTKAAKYLNFTLSNMRSKMKKLTI
jgi:two-component system, NtrC family, response regulator AtoC